VCKIMRHIANETGTVAIGGRGQTAPIVLAQYNNLASSALIHIDLQDTELKLDSGE
jgi:hypothetical protein